MNLAFLAASFAISTNVNFPAEVESGTVSKFLSFFYQIKQMHFYVNKYINATILELIP